MFKWKRKSTYIEKATRSMTAVIRLMWRTLSLRTASGYEPLSEPKKAEGIRSAKPAIKSNPLPTSLMTSSNSCSVRRRPPIKKQKPRHSNRLARIEPSIAALMTGIRLLSTLLWSSTMKRTISTSPPRKVSSKTPRILSVWCLGSILFPCSDFSRGERFFGQAENMRTNNLRQLPCQLLSGKSNQICSRDHGDVVQDEDPQMEIWPGEMDSDRRRYERPESVDRHGYMTCGPNADPQEVPRVYPRSSTFTIWLNASCNLVPVVVVDWHMHMVSRLLLLSLG